MTAGDLLTRLRPFGPAVEDGALVLDADPPPDLLSALGVLHTGVRAVLTGRCWWASTVADGRRPQVLDLDLDRLIPARVALLCVEGDERWDHVPPAARADHPGLFDPDG